MMTRAQETAAVKAAVSAAGYKVRNVEHGRGTAYCWIHVNLAQPAPYPMLLEVEQIAAQAAGRETWGNNCIGVSGTI